MLVDQNNVSLVKQREKHYREGEQEISYNGFLVSLSGK